MRALAVFFFRLVELQTEGVKDKREHQDLNSTKLIPSPPPPRILSSSSPPSFLALPQQRVATCSSDRTIKVFDVSGDQQTLVANLTGHDGPVWMCAWAHPKFGTLLASCGFDHKVIVWKESEQGVFGAIYTSPSTLHEASINAVAWAPHEFGLSLVGSIQRVDHHGQRISCCQPPAHFFCVHSAKLRSQSHAHSSNPPKK